MRDGRGASGDRRVLAMDIIPALSAQCPVDERGEVLHEGDLVAQIALSVTKLEHALGRAGLTPSDVAALTIRTVDPAGVAAALDVVVDHLAEAGARPDVQVVAVDHLPRPGTAVALDCRVSRSPSTHP
jgi:enamine deaminase RidA (YjgF/YER057c/UK114 family)